MYSIDIAIDALKELKKVPVFYRRLLEVAIDRQLVHHPSQQTKNRKCLSGLAAGFEFEEPLWELRIGDWRIFYDIDEDNKTVVIRAVRRKQQGQTTKEIV